MGGYWRFGFIEDLDKVRHIPVGKIWGVPVYITPLTWLGPLVFFGLHAALSLLGPRESAAVLVRNGAVFVVAVEVGTFVHALGHIAGGKLVGSPMDELLFTATRGVNIYRGDQNGLLGRVHLGRAAGGPVLNLVFAALAALVAAGLRLLPVPVTGLVGVTLNSVMTISLYFGLGGLLLPLPSVDGQVIWREVLRSRLVRRAPRPAA